LLQEFLLSCGSELPFYIKVFGILWDNTIVFLNEIVLEFLVEISFFVRLFGKVPMIAKRTFLGESLL
jgi:hypothetical protein